MRLIELPIVHNIARAAANICHPTLRSPSGGEGGGGFLHDSLSGDRPRRVVNQNHRRAPAALTTADEEADPPCSKLTSS